MPKIAIGLLAGLLIGLSACGEKSSVEATVLRFTDVEPQGKPTPVRMIITRDHIRIDDGGDDKSFVLFSRRDRVIYNVSAADQMVLLISPAQAPSKPPVALVHSRKEVNESLPAIAGHRVRHVQLLTNGKLCYDVYAAENLLPEAVAAMREFIGVLAGDQAQSPSMMPRELLTPCYLANNIHAATRYLDHGFPIRRAEPGGRVSELNDFKLSVPVDRALFVLPADVRRMNIRELRGR